MTTKKILLALAIIGTQPTALRAQTGIDEILTAIEQNNTTLKALRETAGSEKLGNKTDIYPADPEIGFNYLWGSPSAIGTRKDFSVSQEFDFATLSGLKSKMAMRKNGMVDRQYMADRMSLLLEAKQYCIDIIYYNALLHELSVRHGHAKSIADARKRLLDSGGGNVLEYNKARLNLTTVEGETAKVTAERNAVEAQLARLNGGIGITLTATTYDPVQAPADFDSWYRMAETSNPVLEYAREEVEMSKRQLSLTKAMSLPVLSAGYMSEKTAGEHFQGITVGVSVPLWSNKNRVRRAKSAVRAVEARRADAKMQLYSSMKILYRRIHDLKSAADIYRASLKSANSSELLKKALDAGEISLPDYLQEIGMYYDVMSKALDAEREYQKACAELYAIEL